MQSGTQHLIETRLGDLRPTQMTFGRAEVERKLEELRGLKRKERERRVGRHWFPAVLGPKARYYIVDHHHLGLALRELGISKVWVVLLDDLSWLGVDAFWRTMEFRRWAHPYDERGQRHEFGAIPKRLKDLRDDPYRGLAGLARQRGAFAKDITPYSEFLWADYFRTRIGSRLIEREPAKALAQAARLAAHREARYLPGWTG
jgi:hypothetical protein